MNEQSVAQVLDALAPDLVEEAAQYRPKPHLHRKRLAAACLYLVFLSALLLTVLPGTAEPVSEPRPIPRFPDSAFSQAVWDALDEADGQTVSLPFWNLSEVSAFLGIDLPCSVWLPGAHRSIMQTTEQGKVGYALATLRTSQDGALISAEIQLNYAKNLTADQDLDPKYVEIALSYRLYTEHSPAATMESLCHDQEPDLVYALPDGSEAVLFSRRGDNWLGSAAALFETDGIVVMLRVSEEIPYQVGEEGLMRVTCDILDGFVLDDAQEESFSLEGGN